MTDARAFIQCISMHVMQVLAQGKGRRPAANKVMDHKNLYVFTAWSDWSQCSACDKVHPYTQRIRFHECQIIQLQNFTY